MTPADFKAKAKGRIAMASYNETFASSLVDESLQFQRDRAKLLFALDLLIGHVDGNYVERETALTTAKRTFRQISGRDW